MLVRRFWEVEVGLKRLTEVCNHSADAVAIENLSSDDGDDGNWESEAEVVIDEINLEVLVKQALELRSDVLANLGLDTPAIESIQTWVYHLETHHHCPNQDHAQDRRQELYVVKAQSKRQTPYQQLAEQVNHRDPDNMSDPFENRTSAAPPCTAGVVIAASPEHSQ